MNPMRKNVHVTIDGINGAETVKTKMRAFMSVDGTFRNNVKIPEDVYILVDTMIRRRNIMTNEITRKTVLAIAAGDYSFDEYCVTDGTGRIVWSGQYRSHGDEFRRAGGGDLTLWKYGRSTALS